jgi:hypothetical protein
MEFPVAPACRVYTYIVAYKGVRAGLLVIIETNLIIHRFCIT